MFTITTPNDVTAEETTSQDSSTEEITQETETTSEATASDEGTQTTEEQSVPYSRFKEVNDRLKAESESKAEYEKRLKEMEGRLSPQDPKLQEVKKVLKELGYVTKDEVEADLKREREDARLNLELSRLESKFNGKDGLPKFNRDDVVAYAIEQGISNPEAAYRQMHFDKIVDWNVKNALGKTGGVKSEKSDGSGSSQVGTSNSDLKKAAMQGDKTALRSFIRRVTFGADQS